MDVMRVKSTSMVLVGAWGFGELMRLLAGLAGRPSYSWIQWVVNWGALWLLVPLLAGRGAGTRCAAAALAGAAASVETATYYGPSNLDQFKIGWMLGGAVIAGVIGTAGRWSRPVHLSWLMIPALMLVEPMIWIGLFAVLGRPASTGLTWSGAGEEFVGIMIAIIGFRSRFRRSVIQSARAKAAAI